MAALFYGLVADCREEYDRLLNYDPRLRIKNH
jgi:hypothetical protein